MNKNFFSKERDEYLRELKNAVLNNEDVSIPGEYKYLTEEWRRSAQADVPQGMDELTDSTRDMQVFERISDFDKFRLAYLNDYYTGRDELLGKLGCAIYYSYEDLSVFRKAGNSELLAELRSHGLRMGSKLSVENVGVMPANLSRDCPEQIICRMGNENYLEMFSKYACFSRFWNEERRNARRVMLLVITPVETCTELVQDTINFLMMVEGISHDIYYPFTKVRGELLEADAYARGTLDLYMDEHGDVVFVSKRFEEIFGKFVAPGPLQGIGQFMPELSYLTRHFDEYRNPCQTREVMLLTAEKKNGFFMATPEIITAYNGKKGLHCTLEYSAKKKKTVVGKNDGSMLRYNFGSIIGRSTAMAELKGYAQRAAVGGSNVLILGESGTGKELFAQAIHSVSREKDGPFVPINCAALSKELLYSELFGYEDGAFTGATKGGAPGKFEQANGGTIFLDEIGDMPLDMQSALLRVLEDSTVVRVGGKKYIQVDVRVIAATNQDLWKKVKNGSFRADLYFRLNIVTLKIPPLRERLDDIGVLSYDMLARLSKKNGLQELRISPELLRLFQLYSWPGNVRELRNVLERCVNFSKDGYLSPEQLPEDMLSMFQSDRPTRQELPAALVSERVNWRGYDGTTLVELLKKHGGNKSKAAADLGVSRATFYKRLKEYGIE